jgi:hypothetical protein
MGHIGATDSRITANNHGPQQRLVHQRNGQMGAPSPGQERTLHAFTRQWPQRPWPWLRRMFRTMGRQQMGSSSNRTRPRETPRVTPAALVEWLVTRGFVVDHLPGFLDGMQGVRGSNPLSSTRHNTSAGLPLRAICQQIVSRSLCVSTITLSALTGLGASHPARQAPDLLNGG